MTTTLSLDAGWHVEWESFAIEYPVLAADDRSAWLDRLARTLRLFP